MVRPKELEEPITITVVIDAALRERLEAARGEDESLSAAARRLLLAALEPDDDEPAPARVGVASNVDRSVTLMERVALTLWTPGHDRSDFRNAEHMDELLQGMGLPPSWQREDFKRYVSMAPDGKPRADRTLLTEFFNKKAEAAHGA